MRIITGSRRGRKLKTLPGDAVRPTPDRVKEALFNILQFDLEGRVFLDLFAGSGQIGLEALSRGAKRAVFVDSAKASCGVVLENIHTTGFENEAQVMNAEYASYLLRCTETFDIDLEDLEPKCTVRVTAYRDGQKLEFDTLCRVDVPAEVDYIANGGILQYVLRRMAQ